MTTPKPVQAVYTPQHVVTPEELAQRLHIPTTRVWSWLMDPDKFPVQLPRPRMIGLYDLGWPSGVIDDFISSLPDHDDAHRTLRERETKRRREDAAKAKAEKAAAAAKAKAEKTAAAAKAKAEKAAAAKSAPK